MTTKRFSQRVRRRDVAVFLWLLAVMACFVGIYPLLEAVAKPGPTITGESIEQFKSGYVSRPERLVTLEGFRGGDQGLYLNPGDSGRLVYRVPVAAGNRVGLNLWMASPTGVTSKVLARVVGHPDSVLAINPNTTGDRFVVSAENPAATSVDFEFEAQNNSERQVLVISLLETYSLNGPDVKPPAAYGYVFAGCLTALITLAIIRRRRHALPVAIAMGGVVAIAAYARLTALFAVTTGLDPDAGVYRIYSDRFQWWPLFDKGIFSGNFGDREPLFPMVVHLYFQVLGSSDFHMRLVSATLSIAVVILTVIAAGRLLVSWPARLAVGLMVAVSEPLIVESTRGLRLELETLLVLLLYMVIARRSARRPFVDAAVIGLVGAAVVLTRSSFLPLVGVAVTVSLLMRYRPLPKAAGLIALAATIVFSAVALHRLGLYEHQGNAFIDSNNYARWLANVEHFAYRIPLPHPELFPSEQDYGKFGPYFGPDISTTQYVFVLHTPQGYLRDSIAGLRAMFDSVDGFFALTGPFTSLEHRLGPRIDIAVRWLIVLGMVGLCLRALRHPRLSLIPIMVMTWLASVAFFYDHALIERYRHTWQVMPLALIAAAWLVERAAIILVRRFGFRWHPSLHYRRIAANLDLTLFPLAAAFALALQDIPLRFAPIDVGLLVASVAVLIYRRPTAGIGALLIATSVGGTRTGLATGAAALIAVVARERPPVRILVPLLVMAPLGLAVVATGGHSALETLLFVGTMALVVATVAVASHQPSVRGHLPWLLAAAGPFTGVSYFIHPAAASPALLVPAGVVAAVWLHLRGHRWALALAVIDLVIVVLAEPLSAWLGTLAAVAWLVFSSGRLSEMRLKAVAAAAALAGVAIVAGTASIGAAAAPVFASWRTALTDTSLSVRQRIVVDRAGDDSIWIFGRRASTAADYPVRVEVNNTNITSDLNSYLSADSMTWARIPLAAMPRIGDTLDIQLIATGQPNSASRYIEVGGVYAQTASVASSFLAGSRIDYRDLSDDAGTQAGTYLIYLGDASLPRPPSGLTAPLVQGFWQPPIGSSPGESVARPLLYEQAGTWQLWAASLRLASENLRGLGDGKLAAALNGPDGGLGTGLSARNEYLQAAAEWGLPGLAGLLVLLAGAAWYVRRREDVLPAALLLLTVISMAGESVLLEHSGAAATWLVIGLCLAARPLAISTAALGPTAPDQPAAAGATASPTARA